MEMTGKPIEAIMINPGFVKPTQLYANGQSELEKTWSMMVPEARVQYGHRASIISSYS